MSRMIMNTLNRGDMVQITDYERDSDKIYTIKEIKKIKKGGILHLLKSLDDYVLRLYYENKEHFLKKYVDHKRLLVYIIREGQMRGPKETLKKEDFMDLQKMTDKDLAAMVMEIRTEVERRKPRMSFNFGEKAHGRLAHYIQG